MHASGSACYPCAPHPSHHDALTLRTCIRPSASGTSSEALKPRPARWAASLATDSWPSRWPAARTQEGAGARGYEGNEGKSRARAHMPSNQMGTSSLALSTSLNASQARSTRSTRGACPGGQRGGGAQGCIATRRLPLVGGYGPTTFQQARPAGGRAPAAAPCRAMPRQACVRTCTALTSERSSASVRRTSSAPVMPRSRKRELSTPLCGGERW